MPRVLEFSAAAIVVTLSPPALAEPASLELAGLRWTRAEGAGSCPDAPSLARAVEARLGRPALVTLDEARLVVDASVTARLDGGFRVAIALTRDGEPIGHRELESPELNCGHIAEEAALVIALMIDPSAPVAAPAPSVTEASEAGPAAPSEGNPPPRPAPARSNVDAPPHVVVGGDRPESWHADLELGVAIAGGLLPGLAAGVLLRGRALPPTGPVVFELEGAYFPPREAEANPGKGGHFQLFYTGLSLCSRAAQRSRVAVSACAGAEAGAMAGQGFGFEDIPRFQSFYLALAARGDLWIRPLPSFAVVLGPALGVPLKRDHFETTDPTGTTELFRMSAVTLAFQAGAVWQW